MSTINNQTNDLYSLNTVQDLSETSAAAIQGGILVYRSANFRNEADVQATRDLRTVLGGRFNNTITSIINNTQKNWVFYNNFNFNFNTAGGSFSLRPGQRISDLSSRFDNTISSLRS